VAQGNGNADIHSDLRIIINSMRMLPPWVPAEAIMPWLERGGPPWWSRFKEVHDSYSLRYLKEKLTMIMESLDPDRQADRSGIHEACIYVLKFFDIPALYEHLDQVATTWIPVVPGSVGKRWSETICSAAWRVLVATEPYDIHAHDRFVPPGYP
jgi:hypothetical protein